ncbi:hypothetical protein MJO28_010069 [Puccinia striiformis f. sp. tritici]|uniref:Uncharacterized protein n=1 Tax=Puccinia striiformis f. sp. tritici TaxID=168172 RepID=A0ACC0EB37_9BASI|nr:hypothetical protein MJO28_010069 [Puccinia striiformis f. sp. tritici]
MFYHACGLGEKNSSRQSSTYFSSRAIEPSRALWMCAVLVDELAIICRGDLAGDQLGHPRFQGCGALTISTTFSPPSQTCQLCLPISVDHC